MKASNRFSKLHLFLIQASLLFSQFASAQATLSIDSNFKKIDFPFGCHEVSENFHKNDIEWIVVPAYHDVPSDPQPDSLKYLTSSCSRTTTDLPTSSNGSNKPDTKLKIPESLTLINNGFNYWFLRDSKPRFELGSIKYKLPDVGPYELFYCAGFQPSVNSDSRVRFGNLLIVNKQNQTAQYLNIYCQRTSQFQLHKLLFSMNVNSANQLEVDLFEYRGVMDSYESFRHASHIKIHNEPETGIEVSPKYSTDFHLPFGCSPDQINSDQLVLVKRPEDQISRKGYFLSNCISRLNWATIMDIDLNIPSNDIEWVNTGIEIPSNELDTFEAMLQNNVKYQLPNVGRFSCYYSSFHRDVAHDSQIFFHQSTSIDRLIYFGSLIFYSEEDAVAHFVPVYELYRYEEKGVSQISFYIDEEFNVNLYQVDRHSDNPVKSFCDIEITEDPEGISFTIEPATN